MFERLGVGHLTELTAGEAVLGFLTPLFVMAALAVLNLVLPGRRVPGYVIDTATGQPRSYRLNGLLVFVAAQVLWWSELTGMPRDWFYRSSLYAVAGGTVLAVVLTAIAVFAQPRGDVKSRFLAWWLGRGAGDAVLQRSHRPQDVLLRGGRHHAVAQRVVGRGVALRECR